MGGHRTRLVQESSVGRHDDEDEALERYVRLSKRMDRAAIVFSLVPRIWLLVGLAGLARHFVAVDRSIGLLAAELGATLLAAGALGKITTSLSTLADAAISWRQVAPLVAALQRIEPAGHVDTVAEPLVQSSPARAAHSSPRRISRIASPNAPSPCFTGCGFRIHAGDRIHLTGPSGAGKSTLISMLTALRAPDSGLLLLDGLDRATLGVAGVAAPRRRRSAVPGQLSVQRHAGLQPVDGPSLAANRRRPALGRSRVPASGTRRS